jgi:O-antigen/teichoic acid export membrane protein
MPRSPTGEDSRDVSKGHRVVAPTRVGILGASANTLVTTLLGSGAGIVLGIVMARALGPGGKGTVDLMVAVAGLASLAFGFSMASGITYQVARRAIRGELVPSFGSLAAVLLGVVTLVVLGVFREPLASAHIVPNSGIALLVLGAVLTAFTFYQSLTRAALAGAQRIVHANNVDLIGRVLSVSAGFAVAAWSASPEAFLIVLIASAALSASWQTASLRPRGRPTRAEATGVMRYSVPSYAANLLQFLNYRLDLFLVAAFWGSADVGLYAVAGSLVQLIWLIYRSAAAVLFPALAAGQIDEHALGRLAEAARLATVLAALGALALGAAATIGLTMVYGNEFQGSVLPLLLLLPGAVALTPAGVAAAFFLASGRPHVNALISAGGFIVTLVGDLVLIPRLGIVGAAVASSLSYTSTLVFTLAYLRSRYHLAPNSLLVPSISDVRRLADAVGMLMSRRTSA